MVEVIFIGVVFGIGCTVAAMIVSLGMASSCGLVHHVRDKRNLLTGVVQVVCYLMPFLVLWEIFGAATGIGVMGVLGHDPTFGAKVSGRINPHMLAFFVWLIPNLVCGLIYWRLARTAVGALRYANR
jgi:hypothetical protein